MKSARGAVTIDFLIFVAGVLIAIVFFIGIVWPWMLSIWYGSCWADARGEIRTFGQEIESGIRSPDSPLIEKRIVMGDCIAGVLFLNSEEARTDYLKLFQSECSNYSGFKSYMIAVPKEFIAAQTDPAFRERFRQELDDLKKSARVWDAIRLWIKEKLGMTPPAYCWELEHSFSETGIKSLPEGFLTDWTNKWNPGTTPYCLTISPVPAQGGYNYRITQNPCPVQTPSGRQ